MLGCATMRPGVSLLIATSSLVMGVAAGVDQTGYGAALPSFDSAKLIESVTGSVGVR